jgi:hypothetical protein
LPTLRQQLRSRPADAAVLAVTLLMIAIGGWVAAARGNQEFVIYVGVLVVLVVAVGVVHLHSQLSLASLWALSAWGAAHLAGGLWVVPDGWPIDGPRHVLYSLWLIPDRLKYDQVVHAFGFGVTTWVCWQALRASLAHRSGRTPDEVQPTFGWLVLCAAAGMGFGALNEVLEFAATLLVPEVNVGGYYNTGWDLVSNLVGSSLAVSAIALAARRRAA